VRALRLFRFGLSATLSHFGLAFVVCVLFGGISGGLSALIFSLEPQLKSLVPPGEIWGMMAVLLPDMVLQLGATILVGPIFQAAAAYAAFRHSRGKPGSVSHGINFGLTRYKRMLGPHARAWLRILIGIQLFLLPGIIFWNQLALVDAVAVFEKSKDPLRRSRQLTKGYRRTIFIMGFPWLFYSIPAFFIIPQLLAVSTLMLIPHQIAVAAYLFVVFAGYARLTLERTGLLKEPDEAPVEGEVG